MSGVAKGSAGEADDQSHQADASGGTWIDHVELQRDRRRRAYVIAFSLTIALVVLIWSAGRQWDDAVTTDDMRLSATAEFKLQCRRVRDGETTTLMMLDEAIDDEIFADAEGIDEVRIVQIDRGFLGDRSALRIAKLPHIEQVRLRYSPVGDEGLRALSKSNSIWLLNLPQAQCSSDGVASLSEMPSLRSLRLGSPRLSGDVARSIEKIQSLRTLHLIGIPITDDGLRRIAAMPRLESLYLDDTAVTDAGWRWLFKNHAHLHVHINQQHHDRDPNRHRHR